MSSQLLDSLGEEDVALLEPLLTPVTLVRGSIISLPGQEARRVYFLESGFVSVLLRVGQRESEVGLVGREGMLGVPSVLGSETPDYRAIARHDAQALQIDVEPFRRLIATRRSVGSVVLRYMQSAVAQLAHTSFANACLTIPQRLARWLLMADDRVGGEALGVTHDVLSLALGVRRPGITKALHELEGHGAIRARPRAIAVLDRDKLVALTEGAYGPAEAAAEVLVSRRSRIGPPPSPPRKSPCEQARR